VNLDLSLLDLAFVRNALIAALLASVLCGVVGTFVVVKRLVFVSGGISHAAFGGLGLCYFLGLDYRWGAAAAAVACAVALASPGAGRGRSHDATIGILWAVGMALGIVFIHATPGYAPNLMTYLFGNVLTVTGMDVALTAGFVIVLLAGLAAFWKELVAVAFDEAFAAVQGVRVRLVVTALLIAIALAVVFLLQLVGSVLAIALLTIPAALALRLVRGFGAVMAAAVASAAAMSVSGLALSYSFDLPSGPTIVLVGAAMLVVVAAGERLRRAGPRRAAAAVPVVRPAA
jgi:zinc transport system permease protein